MGALYWYSKIKIVLYAMFTRNTQRNAARQNPASLSVYMMHRLQ